MRFFVGILLVATLIGCSSDPRDNVNATPSESSDVLQREKFIEVMCDIQLIEAASKNKVFRNDDEALKLGAAYKETFEKHGVTQTEFEESHKWWWSHPQAMKSVLLEVTERLTQKEGHPAK